MKVLIIALGPQLLGALEAQFVVRSRAFKSVGLEWLQSSSLTIPSDIDIVVNTVTFECLQGGHGDGCEALTLLAQACEQSSTPLIQLSSSRVFDGTSGRHKETDVAAPGSALGEALFNAEELLRASCNRHIILRTGPLFSSMGDNLLTDLIAKFKGGESLRLSNKGKSCPMHAKDLARVISAIIDQLSCGCEAWGTYHYSSTEPISSFQFAETVLAVASQYIGSDKDDMALELVDGDGGDWACPLLNCEKILNTFGIQQLSWRSFIVPAVQEIFAQEKTTKELGRGE
ncbi:MAG: sugar nucleotide-binding protein [Spongiibacteraceae bacterium]